jgi:hypothetical protein
MADAKDGADAVPRWVELKWDGRLFVDEKQILSPTNLPGRASVWHSELTFFEDVRFAYMKRMTPDRPSEWMNSWDMSERKEFPAAIRVTYKIKGETAILIVPLDYAEASWRGALWQ